MKKHIAGTASLLSLLCCAWTLAGDYPNCNQNCIGVPLNLLDELSPSIAVTDDALSGVANPAGLAARDGAELLLLTPYDQNDLTDDVGLYARLGKLGFATEWVRRGTLDYERYMLGLGFKMAPGIYWGGSYSWWEGLNRDGTFTLGLTGHPCPYFSLAVVLDDINEPLVDGDRQKTRYTFGLAARPLTDRVTVSADASLYEMGEIDYGDEIDWNFRAEIEPINGFHLSGNYRPETDLRAETFGVGVGLSWGFGRIGTYQGMDSEGEATYGTPYVHFTTGYQRTFLEPKHRFVTVTLDGSFPEEKPPFRLFAPRPTTFFELLERIRMLEEDPHVDGITLVIKNPKLSYAHYQELRNALMDFKHADKKIVCYMETCGNMGYFLASIADKIAMNPSGDVGLVGLRGRAMFFKNTLDKLGIVAELYHIGDYKTASDMLTRESMSEAHREMFNWLLDELYQQYTETVAQARGWSVDKFRELIDNGPYTTASAYQAGLVDTLIYQDEIKDIIKEVGGDRVSTVSGKSYWSRQDYQTKWEYPAVPKIAIVYATGSIVSGKSGGDFMGKTMGSETIADAIRKARKDPRVKAIIFRIDSGGGSALASEVILREVQRCTEGDDAKPIIVSMAGVAGSGGYYIACLADTIIASPGTITGSIGVISGKFNFSGLYQKLGVNFETIKRGERSDMSSGDRSFTDDEWKVVKAQTHEIYDRFVGHVAEGRHMTIQEVDDIGRGRVYTGNQAQKLSLIDEIGGLRLAIEIARQRANIPESRDVEYAIYPEPKGFGFGNEVGGFISDYLSPEIKTMAKEWNKTQTYRDGEPLMLMPFELEVQ
jgi:protease-4